MGRARVGSMSGSMPVALPALEEEGGSSYPTHPPHVCAQRGTQDVDSGWDRDLCPDLTQYPHIFP